MSNRRGPTPFVVDILIIALYIPRPSKRIGDTKTAIRVEFPIGPTLPTQSESLYGERPGSRGLDVLCISITGALPPFPCQIISALMLSFLFKTTESLERSQTIP